MFSFSNNHTAKAVDLISDASNAISAISLIFIGIKPPELSKADASGIYNILNGIRETLDFVSDELTRISHNEEGTGNVSQS